MTTTATQTGRPGAEAGIALATAAWRRLSADDRAAAVRLQTCTFTFGGRWSTRRFENQLWLRDYLRIRLDYLIARELLR